MDVKPSKLDASPLPFLHLMEVLKHLPRTGWLRTVQRPESVASHMYRLSLLAMCAPTGLDTSRCIFLALCHDMAESVVGDIPTYAGVPKEVKRKQEDFGTRYIESLLRPFNANLGRDIRVAWLEYEEGKTDEARFVREMDKLECLIQAHEYEQRTHGEKDLEEFQGLCSKVNSVEGKAWLELLQQERRAHFKKRNERFRVIFVIAPPGAGEETQCALLSKDFGLHQISLQEILQEKANDKTYLHAEFVRDCLEENIDVPLGLAISLLEDKITEGQEYAKRWALVRGFPENLQQLIEFEEKVQKNNYTLSLSCSMEEMLRRAELRGESLGEAASESFTKSVRDFEAQSGDVERHLAAAEKEYFAKINGSGSVQEVYSLVKGAVEGFMQHAQVEG